MSLRRLGIEPPSASIKPLVGGLEPLPTLTALLDDPMENELPHGGRSFSPGPSTLKKLSTSVHFWPALQARQWPQKGSERLPSVTGLRGLGGHLVVSSPARITLRRCGLKGLNPIGTTWKGADSTTGKGTASLKGSGIDGGRRGGGNGGGAGSGADGGKGRRPKPGETTTRSEVLILKRNLT